MPHEITGEAIDAIQKSGGKHLLNLIKLDSEAQGDAEEGDEVSFEVSGRIVINDEGDKFLAVYEADGQPVAEEMVEEEVETDVMDGKTAEDRSKFADMSAEESLTSYTKGMKKKAALPPMEEA